MTNGPDTRPVDCNMPGIECILHIRNRKIRIVHGGTFFLEANTDA
jgi:hypothetical protein